MHEIRDTEKKYLGVDITFDITDIQVVVHIKKDTKQKFHNVVLNIDCPLLYDIREDCNLPNDHLKQRHITVAVMAC